MPPDRNATRPDKPEQMLLEVESYRVSAGLESRQGSVGKVQQSSLWLFLEGRSLLPSNNALRSVRVGFVEDANSLPPPRYEPDTQTLALFYPKDYFEQVQKTCGDAKLAANWVMGDLSSLLNKDDLDIEQSPVSAQQLGEMIGRIKDKTISGNIAKMVFEAMAAGEGNADQIIEAKGLKQVTDTGAIEAMVDEVLANNAEQVEQYRNSDESRRGKMFGFFVGQTMKASKGKANPQQVNQLLKKKLDG